MNSPLLEINEASAQDGASIQDIAASIPLFGPDDVAIVQELWEDYLQDGPANDGYAFLAARQAGAVAGFACYGHRPLTESTFDLYWIAVHPRLHQQGIGSVILSHVEAAVRLRGGKLLIIETSGEEAYAPTQRFYERHGYQIEANIRDFYKPGASLVIFSKRLV
jgi:D-alanine-D-alanine ligase